MSATWRPVYERLLLDPNTSFQAIVDFKANHLPASLFKYRQVEDIHLNALQRNEVWLASPYTFNDGYDSAFRVDHVHLMQVFSRQARNISKIIDGDLLRDKLTTAERSSILQSNDPKRELGRILFQKDSAQHAPEQVEKFLDVLDHAVGKFAEQQFKSSVELMQRALKVCCFCIASTVPPLWAHYTNNKGFCVEYDLTKVPVDDLRLRFLMPVIYGKAPVDVTPLYEAGMLHGPSEFTVRMAFIAASHKAADWSYEQEWRLVNPDGRDIPGMPLYMPVKAIYLGFKISDEDAAKVSAVARGINAPVFRMILGSDASGFTAVPA